MLTHAVYDSLTGETKSEHPDASSAFAAAAKIGGAKYGYVVGPIGFPPDVKKVVAEERDKASENRLNRDKAPGKEGPGLFD